MRWYLVLCGLLFATACTASTEACTETDGPYGSWTYGGEQETPIHTALQGTLTIAGGCDVITGQLDVLEADGLGHTRRLSGMITGRVVDETSIRFDALIDGVTRQHIARLTGDSLTGTWLALSANGAESWTGSFGGRKEHTP